MIIVEIKQINKEYHAVIVHNHNPLPGNQADIEVGVYPNSIGVSIGERLAEVLNCKVVNT